MENIEEFTTRLRSIRKEALQNTGMRDYYHMRSIAFLGQVSFCLSLYACYSEWYVATVFMLAFSLMVKWLLMHHIGHGGYDRIKGIPSRFHSSRYAIGWRKYLDWFDWVKPEAWNYEHNTLHHNFTGELQDPDLVEDNLDWLAQARLPYAMKAVILFLFSFTWKFTYYSARTLSYSRNSNTDPINFSNFFDLRRAPQRTMWLEMFIPYTAFNFVALPLLFEWLLPGMGVPFFLCRMAAELLHNLHTFIIIVPNHSGEDLHRYVNISEKERGGGYYYIRQIRGSVNYKTGNEWIDLSQMYLNYQIEHHLFPNLSMLQYRRIQPQVKALCEEFKVDYIQESVWVRLIKMSRIALGKSTMILVDGNQSKA